MMDRVYRGKSIDGAGNPGEWEYGGIVHQTDYYGDAVDDYYIIDGTSTQDNRIGYETKVDPDTVGQYTGLTDKNGKKIFEGDVVRFPPVYVLGETLPESYASVNYSVDDGEWLLKYSDCSDDGCFDSDAASGCYVIGNIHDNPELIGGGC